MGGSSRHPVPDGPRKGVYPRAAHTLQGLPKQRQPRAKASLPYGLEVYAPKRVLDIAWDDAGTVELIGYNPGEWEWAIKAGEV